MPLDLFEALETVAGEPITDIKNLSSEFSTTHACCEEGQCCDAW